MLRSTVITHILGKSAVVVILASSLVCASAQTATSTAGAALSDVQAQALMQALAAQQSGGAALTSEQSQLLLQYLLSKNGSSGAGSVVGGMQTQMMLQTLSSQVHSIVGKGMMSGHGQALAVPTPPPTAPAAAPVSLGEKKAGVLRIGIAMPKSQLGQTQGPSAGEPLRVMLIQYLTGPTVESTEIAALLPEQVEAEAKSKQCDYIVYSALSQKKPSGGMSFLKNSSALTNMIPLVGMTNTMSKVLNTSTAATSATEAATLSSGIKAKTDVVLEYHLNATGNESPVVSNTLDAKATTDGEDVITPMVEKEASAIMTEVSKKK